MTGRRVTLGFVALDDAASLIVASAHGLFAAEGLEVVLSREVSWATVRDKVDVGTLDGAHLLAPMALGASAPGSTLAPLVAPLALNLDGPAVTLSARLLGANDQASSTAEALGRLVLRRRAEGASPLTLAVVYPYSTHNYLLRNWLASAGVDPDQDVRLIVVAPSRVAQLLADGVIEGFCVTEPWGAAAVAAGVGFVAFRASQLHPRTPDKVFAVREDWAAANPDILQRLLRALLRAAAWAGAAENRRALAQLLAQPQFLGADADVIERSLTDLVLYADAANAPQPAHGAWLARQMQRWGHLPAWAEPEQLAQRVYRPDLFTAAAASLGLPAPALLGAFGGP